MVVDFVRPVETIIPGVQGKVLGVLCGTETELTMRTVARLADVSINQAATVLNRLVDLGVVERRDAGSAALVRLARHNEAAHAVIALAAISDRVVCRLEAAASLITPPPFSLAIFGSFARGEARADSDIDVLAVRPDGIATDDPSWTDSLGRWTTAAREITGNPVNLIEAAANEVPRLMAKRASVWTEIAAEATTLVGMDVRSLARRP